MEWLLSFAPAFVAAAVATGAELVLRPAHTDWRRNLQAWALYAAVGIAILPLSAALGMPSLLHGDALPFWAGFLIFLFVRDGAEFLYHRAQHHVPFLWAMHSMHHSDPDMSALTTQRHYWADQVVKAVTIWPAAALIISPTPGIVAAYGVVSLWHFFVHARLPVNFGALSWLVNSPAYHRRHHSSLPEHYNSNFAALFPIFDVMCGTYNRPDGFPPTGLDHKPESFADLVLWPLRQGEPAVESSPAKSSASPG